ncbi:hypothetical protein CI109_100898 [Kwoniella shandongensis]|uniref:Uncharacterized protein n=1 Tax=Kwoniella shandongensis TaxID=1734106 RepID=A0AAJ8LEP1_9TREE
MSRKPTIQDSAALTSVPNWTPAQQAALYHIHLAQQAEKDEAKAIKEKEKKERKVREEVRPEEVEGGKIVDGWINDWCPPLFTFLDVFAPPHIAIAIFVLAHLTFWYYTPWYFHFFLSWPTTYFIPLWCTYKSIRNGQDKVLWLSHWPILSFVEYLEILLFRDQARALIWWPKLKAIFCIVMYCIIDNDVVLDSRGRPKEKKPVFGAIKLAEKFLPAKQTEKEKDKGKESSNSSKDPSGSRSDRSGSSSRNRSKSSSGDKAKASSRSSLSDPKRKEKEKEKEQSKGKAK